MKEGQTQEPVGWMLETFEDYMRNARNAFVKTITDYFPHEGYQRYGEGGNKIRVAAEDILICFDQMRERLLTPPPSPVGIDVEALATAFADSKERRGCSYWQGLYNGFKAGYSASLPSSSVTGEEWISLKEYEQKALQLLADKPVIKMLVQNGLPFEKWGNNIHDLIDKELGATRELRVKMLSSVTGESEAIGFAEWMGKGFEMIIDGSWECFSEEYCEKYNLQLDEHYTTSGLLSTYKQSKK